MKLTWIAAHAVAAWQLLRPVAGSAPHESERLLLQPRPKRQLHSQIPLGGGGAKEEGPSRGRRPNIIFIITDDQDLHLQSLDYLPFVQKHLVSQGSTYKRHFCTTALCCPSRVSLWTGKQAHNTNVTDVRPPYGGYPKFVQQGFNEAYLPLWLQEAGYNTYYTGKLFNAHTVDNYDAPHVAGWNSSDFLLDPFTYQYLNSTYQRNSEPPVNHPGQHTTDLITEKAYGLLDEAVEDDRPFFLGIAPVAPHANVVVNPEPFFSVPIPAERHEHLFEGVKVPRTENFNPEAPSGADWVRRLPQLSQENVDYIDHFYRQRLRALQGVDELVDGLFERLENYGLLDNTFVFYTSDNGFHMGQHRLQPGKECGFEEDINVPLIVRGPGVPAGEAADIVTSHIDLAPTILDLAGAPLRADLDGDAIPLTRKSLALAEKHRHEHVTVEYWGAALAEGDYLNGNDRWTPNNTYKSLRIIGESYNIYYSVWCNNEHELYDLNTDPGQLHNLLHPSEPAPASLLGSPLQKVVARLDSLLFVLKSCRGSVCMRPWRALHPVGDVRDLEDALEPRFDLFYEVEQQRVRFGRCEAGYIVDAEGPQFETEGLAYRDGVRWDLWT